MSNNRHNLLFDKLNRFISKYYKDKILKGVIYLFATLMFFLFLFSIIEFFSRLSSSGRQLLFWFYLLLNLIVLVKYIVYPFFQLLRIGKTIDYKDAAVIIGNHFPEIDDKILNILQLNELSDPENELIDASITKKTNDIQSFSFRKTINFRQNKKHLKWLFIPSFIIITLVITGNKHMITESSARIIDHNTEYVIEAPFRFVINNERLEIIQQEDFELDVSLAGSKIPNNIYIEVEENRFSLVKNDLTNFKFLFKNVISDIEFKLYADGFYSQKFSLKSILKPNIVQIKANLNYPNYTKRKDEVVSDNGNLTMPEGTIVNWDFKFKNSDSMDFVFDNNLKSYEIINNSVSIQKTILEDKEYAISISNKDIKSPFTNYNIQVVKDQFPQINLKTTLDSVNNVLYFDGNISDDYGLSELKFFYEIIRKDSTFIHSQKLKINNTSSENYYHFLDLNELNLSSGEEVNYFFEVWDNDQINGRKSNKSFDGKYKELTKNELIDVRNLENEKIKTSIDNSIELAKEIQKEIDELKKTLVDKKTIGWEEKKKAENILKKQKTLEDQISENNKRNNKNNKNNEKLNSSILEKQKKLEELMNKVLDDESKKLMQEIQEMLQELNKEEIKEILDKLEKNSDNTEKELERSLELYKELEFEQQLEEIIEKVNQLKDKQIELKRSTENESENSMELSKKQEELQKELEELTDDLNSLEKKNSDLENSKDLPNTKEKQKDASESMEESKQSLDKKQNKKSSKKQEEAIKRLDEISEEMTGLQSSCSSDTPVENIETLRQILENLITLSFDQEELINNISSLPKNSNSIIKYIKKQKELGDNSKIIEDSLFALSKRVVQIESIINKEIREINYNINKSISLFEERKINKGVARQQFVMTSANNLALLLSETLEQMQMDIANSTPGSKQCNKPGSSSKPSLKELKNMQEKLKKEMNGQKGKNGNKQGEMKKSSEGQNMYLMQMAQKQQQIKQRLQEIRDEIGKAGEKGNIDRILEKMEQNEIDILNNNITNETILRQEEILTKLLEAEESQREKGQEEKRESIEWNFDFKNNSSEYIDYINKKKEQNELFRTVPVQLNPYFKEKVNRYFNVISQE